MTSQNGGNISNIMIINDFKAEKLGPNNIMNLCDVLIDEVGMSHIHPRKETIITMNDSWDSALLDEFKENLPKLDPKTTLDHL